MTMIDKGTGEADLVLARKALKEVVDAGAERFFSFSVDDGHYDDCDEIKIALACIAAVRATNPTPSSPTDTARVDWLEKHRGPVSIPPNGWLSATVGPATSLRALIDSEMEKDKP